MKKNIFITTSITIFLVQLLVFPFAFTASAMESLSVPPQSAEIVVSGLDDSSLTPPLHYDMNIYPTNNVPSDTSVRGSYYSFNVAELGNVYNNVLSFNAQFTEARKAIGWIHLDYGISSFKDFNSVKFDIAVWAPADTSKEDLSDFFLVKFNNQFSLDGITVKYNLSSAMNPGSPVPGVSDTFRRLSMSVFFDEPYRYDTLDVDLYVKTYIPYFGAYMRYLIGCSDLTYSKITQEEFVAGIASDVSNIDNKLGEANEKLGIIGDTMTDIKDILSAGLSEEESQKIMDSREQLENNSIILETYEENIEAVDEELNFYFESYDSIEYDLFGDTYMNHVEEYVEPVFENDPFMGFWYGFFSHPFVIAMIIVSLTFCAVGFVMYGVR